MLSTLKHGAGMLIVNAKNEILENIAPMGKYEKRRLNLIKLRDEKCDGVNAKLARKIARESSYVNRMFYPEGKKGKKRIGDDIKELIETEFDLPIGWLDGIQQEDFLGIEKDKLTIKHIEMMKKVASMDDEELSKADSIFKIVEAPERSERESEDGER